MSDRFAPGGVRLQRAGRYAADVARQFHLTMILAIVIGVLTGVAVAVFDKVVAGSIEVVSRQGLLVVAVLPAVGLLVVSLLVVWWKDPDTATTDAYVRAYHERDGRLGLPGLWRKVIGSAVTLGSGNAFGFEGPAMLIGGTIGSTVEGRFASRFRRDDAKVLMVAGAAAGVAAVFKAPLTGVIFALEVPYRSDQARRALLPSLAAAGAAYVTYVLFTGTGRLLPAGGSAPFDLRDLGGGIVLGLICGALARAGAHAIGAAKHLRLPRWARLTLAGVGMIGLALVARWWFGAPLQLGPSYEAIRWAAEPSHGVGVLCGLFAVRAAATWFGVAGGGMGGLFIPLVTQGAVVGSLFEHLVDSPNPHLFPTIGIAAFLGAGYRTPLAGVAFVAEATGEPGFLVPALLAAAAAQLVMGNRSFSAYQRHERLPNLDPLSEVPVLDIMSPNPDTIDADADLETVVATMMAKNRRWAPVIDDGTYVGLVAVTAIANVPMAQWRRTAARTVARGDVPPVSTVESVADVAERMRSLNVEAMAVIADGTVVGVITSRDVRNVTVLLDRLGDGAR